MDKKSKSRFLKNRKWKSRCLNRLKGRAEDICKDYLNGMIDASLIRPRMAFIKKNK